EPGDGFLHPAADARGGDLRQGRALREFSSVRAVEVRARGPKDRFPLGRALRERKPQGGACATGRVARRPLELERELRRESCGTGGFAIQAALTETIIAITTRIRKSTCH